MIINFFKVANYLHTFGARIYGLGRTETNANECLSGYFATSDIRKFLNLCDYVINVLPNTEGSKGLLNGDMLENCKGTIYLIPSYNFKVLGCLKSNVGF